MDTGQKVGGCFFFFFSLGVSVCIKTGAGGRRGETELPYPKHLLQGIKHAVVCAAELRVAPRRTHGSGTERSASSHLHT